MSRPPLRPRPAILLAGLMTLCNTSLGQELTRPPSLSTDQPSDQSAGTPPTPVESATRFLRVVEVEDRPTSLQTAITRYASASGRDGATVDLIAAVHIGEQDYYDRLNEAFRRYDVVLYELVAPAGTTIPRGGRQNTGHPLGLLQDAARSMLGLESQLAEIDYSCANFVRADMTPAQMRKKMEARGDTAVTVALSTLADVMRQSNLAAREQRLRGEPMPPAAEDLFELLGDPVRMKQMMALQFAAHGSLDNAMGDTLNTMLVVDRNIEALKGLQQQLAAGKRRVAIFYGAAHMPDFERRLVADFGLRKTRQSWLDAWDLTRSHAGRGNDPAALLLELLK